MGKGGIYEKAVPAWLKQQLSSSYRQHEDVKMNQPEELQPPSWLPPQPSKQSVQVDEEPLEEVKEIPAISLLATEILIINENNDLQTDVPIVPEAVVEPVPHILEVLQKPLEPTTIKDISAQEDIHGIREPQLEEAKKSLHHVQPQEHETLDIREAEDLRGVRDVDLKEMKDTLHHVDAPNEHEIGDAHGVHKHDLEEQKSHLNHVPQPTGDQPDPAGVVLDDSTNIHGISLKELHERKIHLTPVDIPTHEFMHDMQTPNESNA